MAAAASAIGLVSAQSRLLSLAAAAAAASGIGLASAQTRLSIQPCAAQWQPNLFAITSGKIVTQGGQCVDFDDTSLILSQCDGSAQQQWTFHPDGTVENAASAGNCWSVLEGLPSAGVTVGMHSCGSREKEETTKVAVAENGIFWPLPSSSQIFANESGLCLASSAAPRPGRCNDLKCCQLNGIYDEVSGKCGCFAPWTGANCSVLSLLPSKKPGAYGWVVNETTWGGNFVKFNGEYHMLVTEIQYQCSLEDWRINSACVHATSPTPEGPFTKQGVAVGIWCHNPQVVAFTNGSQTTFALFHIGDGTGGNPKNCTSGLTGDDAPEVEGYPKRDAASGSTVHIATDPAGPWVPLQPQPPDCNNPAPYLHANGTWFLLCESRNLFSAPSLYGPWREVTTLNPSGGVNGTYEDAFLYIDPRGFWHVLFHVYITDVTPTCVGSTVSGHFYSPDGLDWYASLDEPFGNLIEFDDGSTMLVSTRERPKLFFDLAGNPTHLINGVCSGADVCASMSCVQCKRFFWDSTIVQPLNMLPPA